MPLSININKGCQVRLLSNALRLRRILDVIEMPTLQLEMLVVSEEHFQQIMVTEFAASCL